jgi:hypothetical protein
MYDPFTARFLQPDPLGLDLLSPNLYLYCSNDPVNQIDPSGLQPELAPPPREVGGSSWITAPDAHELGRIVCPNYTWKTGPDNKTICTAKLTIQVFGYRSFRTFRGGTRLGNFRVFVELRYTYSNVRCTEPCKPEMKEEDRIMHIWSGSMDNGILLEGEVETYTTRFIRKLKNCENFEEDYLAGFYKLVPVKPEAPLKK